MKSRALIVLSCIALAGAGIVYLARRAPASAPAKNEEATAAAAPARATDGKPPSLPPPSPKLNASAAPRDPGPVVLKTESDAEAVFQRAFWRKPGPDVRILDGERREWADGNGVQQWQWYVAVQSTPEFRQWLLEQNPFELVRAEKPVEPAQTEKPAPKWFPETATRAQMTSYRTPGGRLMVFVDAKSGRLFATDAGAGFAAAVR